MKHNGTEEPTPAMSRSTGDVGRRTPRPLCGETNESVAATRRRARWPCARRVGPVLRW